MKNLSLSKVYQLIEPGPVVLVTTSHRGKPNIMPLSWHVMMEFEPPLIGLILSNRNHSYKALVATRECVINIPEASLARQLVGCGNSSGKTVDKFKKFGLTAVTGETVRAPLISECFASLECRVVDTRLVRKYCFFVVEVLKAWTDPKVKNPRTLHHRGNGVFMVAGKTLRLRSGKK